MAAGATAGARLTHTRTSLRRPSQWQRDSATPPADGLEFVGWGDVPCTATIEFHADYNPPRLMLPGQLRALLGVDHVAQAAVCEAVTAYATVRLCPAACLCRDAVQCLHTHSH